MLAFQYGEHLGDFSEVFIEIVNSGAIFLCFGQLNFPPFPILTHKLSITKGVPLGNCNLETVLYDNYYKNEMHRFYHALNCSHYKRIMIQRLRQYLDKYAFMRRATMLVCHNVCFEYLHPTKNDHFIEYYALHDLNYSINFSMMPRIKLIIEEKLISSSLVFILISQDITYKLSHAKDVSECCSTKMKLRYKCYYNQRLLLAGIRGTFLVKVNKTQFYGVLSSRQTLYRSQLFPLVSHHN
ncbi:hypothetical protein T11_13528 [Trichinella zimbabwensis]|uniref:Uncharacterized protein n=1 Tax=Trichinella zimbabwensis TaxID=268475 RepID=A0A0V1HXB5_9BILA|nr:hypothetical protein T11_13528 [Trichinella zimbabwensis]